MMLLFYDITALHSTTKQKVFIHRRAPQPNQIRSKIDGITASSKSETIKIKWGEKKEGTDFVFPF